MVSKLGFIAIGAIPYWQIGQFFTATGTIELPLSFQGVLWYVREFGCKLSSH
jgi:hypothetical protein